MLDNTVWISPNMIQPSSEAMGQMGQPSPIAAKQRGGNWDGLSMTLILVKQCQKPHFWINGL